MVCSGMPVLLCSTNVGTTGIAQLSINVYTEAHGVLCRETPLGIIGRKYWAPNLQYVCINSAPTPVAIYSVCDV